MSGIPKRLRQAIRCRRRVIEKLQDEASFVGPRRVIQLAKLVSDLDRTIQTREWQHDRDFDPVAMGM